MLNFEKYKPQISNLCGNFPIKQLGIFGSAHSEKFSPESDIDIFVKFEKSDNIDLFDTYFSFKEKLEKIFDR